MSSKAMSLKGRINNYAKKNKIAAQVVLQNYMFECFLERLSKSEYNKKFVIKGGMLISSLVGLDTRATMDLDGTLRRLSLTEENLLKLVKDVCSIKLHDEVTFEIKGIVPIRKDDRYGGFRIRIDAIYDTITTPLSIDASTGDVITPEPVEYEFTGLFDDTKQIKLWGYNLETVLAEKAETILARGIFNTRPRDFYDIYILGTTKKYDKEVFQEALAATAEHRGSIKSIKNKISILNQLLTNDSLKQTWSKYQNKFPYAKNIAYEDTLEVLRQMVN